MPLLALTHIVVEFGTRGDDNLLSRVDALVDTGAGCTIGNLDYWAGEGLTNPSMHVAVYTCKDGKYAPLTTHDIDDANAEGGAHNNTTQLTVDFRLCTVYKLRCGKELHLMMGLGKDVAVKFILGNPWLKNIGKVIDYGGHYLRAPLHLVLNRFPLVYKHPEQGPAPVGHGSAAAHQAVFANLSNMIPFVKVLNAFSKDCPRLGYANQMIITLQSCTLDTIPARICADDAAKETGDYGAKPLSPACLWSLCSILLSND